MSNNIGRSGIKFEMARYTSGGEELWVNIEERFKGLRYKSCSGLNAYGEPQDVYSESYVEDTRSDVYVSQGAAYGQTEIKLTLLFFEGYGVSTDKKEDASYHDFVRFVSGSKMLYRDTSRGRKALMYLTGVTIPEVDTLYGERYKEVTFTFKNVFGRTFGYDEALPM